MWYMVPRRKEKLFYPILTKHIEKMNKKMFESYYVPEPLSLTACEYISEYYGKRRKMCKEP